MPIQHSRVTENPLFKTGERISDPLNRDKPVSISPAVPLKEEYFTMPKSLAASVT